jgi:hypothetical protein
LSRPNGLNAGKTSYASVNTAFAGIPNGSVLKVWLPLEQVVYSSSDLSAAADPIVSAVRQALGDALADRPGVSLMSRFTVPQGERRGLNPAMNAL